MTGEVSDSGGWAATKGATVSEAMTALPQDSPIMAAWEKYKTSDEYANTFKWAQHTEHRDGSLWAAFLQGWQDSSERIHSLETALVESQGEVEKLKNVLVSIEDDMCHKPVQWDWPVWASRWLDRIREVLK